MGMHTKTYFKIFILLFAFCIQIKAYSQNYIFKKNTFGEIEVTNSSFGANTGTVIAKFKKNALGFIELQTEQSAFRQSYQPWIERPIITPIQPQLSSVSSIMNSINIYLTTLQPFNQVYASKSSSEENEKIDQQVNREFNSIQAKAKEFKQFYNCFNGKPTSLPNGIYSILLMSKRPSIRPEIADEEINKEMSQIMKGIDTVMDNGYAVVVNNKITYLINQQGGSEVYESHDSTTFIGGYIKDCKAILRTGDNLVEVYFIDFLLDSKPLSAPPSLGAINFTLPTNLAGQIIYVYPAKTLSDFNTLCGLIWVVNPENLLPSTVIQTNMKAGNYRYNIKRSGMILKEGRFEVKKAELTNVLIN
jgi:hypothetical protein